MSKESNVSSLQTHEKPYFIKHYFHVLDAVEKYYGELLSPDEHAYITKIRTLSPQARELYVRLINRKGPYFRASQLKYAFTEPLERLLQTLEQQSLLTFCSASLLPYGHTNLWKCYTLDDLKSSFPEMSKILSKVACTFWLERQYPDGAWVGRVCPEDQIICVRPDDRWSFLKYLFFGELTDNLSGFVAQEIGHIVTEDVPLEAFKPQFTTRDEAEQSYKLACAYETFRQLRETTKVDDIYAWWVEQAVDYERLPAKALNMYHKLIERLGQLLEKQKQPALAIQLYTSCSGVPCRERLAKLLIKENRKKEALALCEAIISAPLHDEEAYVAEQIIAKLQKTQKRTQAANLLKFSRAITLSTPNSCVEDAVLEYYKAEGWDGIHSENWLWNNLFGLLFWDIIYDPQYGAFHHPLQTAPTDLYQKAFYSRRAEAIDRRLILLKDRERCTDFLIKVFAEKHAITNPFVYWQEDTLVWVDRLLRHIPSQALSAILTRMAKDLKRHSKGFPDLFIWRSDAYQLLEVKSKSDQISVPQYQWIQFLVRQGVNAATLRVYYSEEKEVA